MKKVSTNPIKNWIKEHPVEAGVAAVGLGILIWHFIRKQQQGSAQPGVGAAPLPTNGTHFVVPGPAGSQVSMPIPQRMQPAVNTMMQMAQQMGVPQSSGQRGGVGCPPAGTPPAGQSGTFDSSPSPATDGLYGDGGAAY